MSTPVTSALQRAIGDAQHALDSHQLSRWLRGSGHLTGGPATPDIGLTVEVPGDAEVLRDGETVAVDEFNNTADVTPDDDRPRWSIISVQSDGSVTATDGEPRTLVGDDDQPAQVRNPAPPLEYPGVCYAAVFVPAGAAEVTADEILDRRLGASIRLGSLLADEIDIGSIEADNAQVVSEPSADTDVVRELERAALDAAKVDKGDSERYESGGDDELTVTGLSGDLADAQDPKTHDNAAHSEDFITGVDTADGTTELGEAIRYVFGNALSVNDLGGGEIEINGSEGGVETIDPNTAVDAEAPTADDSDADNPLAIGVAGNTLANDDNAIAIGNGAEASDSSATALGEGAIASGIGATALGEDAIASGNGATALADSAEATGGSSITLGPNSTASGDRATAVGRLADATGFRSTALGHGADAENENVGTLGVSTNQLGTNDWTVPGDFTVQGSKDFEIDHPSKPETHDLRHGAYEGPVPGGLIYNATVSTDEERISLAGDLPEYVTNGDFGTGWTCHVTASDHFGRGYVDTDEWVLVVEEPGDYEVTIFGERDDEKAVSNGKHRTEKPKGERWNGDPRTYWRDCPHVDPTQYDDVERVEAKFAHTPDCPKEPCPEAHVECRVTFDDGDPVTVDDAEFGEDGDSIVSKARDQR